MAGLIVTQHQLTGFWAAAALPLLPTAISEDMNLRLLWCQTIQRQQSLRDIFG